MIEMLLALHEEVLTTEDKFILSKAHSSFPLGQHERRRNDERSTKMGQVLTPGSGGGEMAGFWIS